MKTSLLISCLWVLTIGAISARRIDFPQDEAIDTPDRQSRKLPKSRQNRRTNEEVVAVARRHAIQLIVEKMYRAFGNDFPKSPNVTMTISDVFPTVSTENITTVPCPEIYSRCSTESFLTSCNPPNGTNARTWNRLYNLYFPLGEDLFEKDNLLNATLQLYKNKTLPIEKPTVLIVELYAYTRNSSRRKEFITSVNVTNDYIGWVTLDITDLISNLRPSNNHGFHIKVKETTGILWNDRHTFVRMDCSDTEKEFIPLPLGVQTDHLEQKFPTLSVRTGSPEQTYHVAAPSYYYVDEELPKETNLVSPLEPEMVQDEPSNIEDLSPLYADTEEIHLAPKRIRYPLSNDFPKSHSLLPSNEEVHASDFESKEPAIHNDWSNRNPWNQEKRKPRKHHRRSHMSADSHYMLNHLVS